MIVKSNFKNKNNLSSTKLDRTKFDRTKFDSGNLTVRKLKGLNFTAETQHKKI